MELKIIATGWISFRSACAFAYVWAGIPLKNVWLIFCKSKTNDKLRKAEHMHIAVVFFFIRFFLMWPIFKLFIEFAILLLHCSVLYFGCLTARYVWGLISLTRDAPLALEGKIVTTGPPGKSLELGLTECLHLYHRICCVWCDVRLMWLTKMKPEWLWYHLEGKESVDSYMDLILILIVVGDLLRWNR